MGSPFPGVGSAVALAIQQRKAQEAAAMLLQQRAFEEVNRASELVSKRHLPHSRCGGCGAVGREGCTCDYCGQVIFITDN